GYRPRELLLGRLVLLELFGLVVSALFSVVMVLGTGPSDAWALVAGVGLVAVRSVPFGLAVGARAPHEVEGGLVVIRVVGIQLCLEQTQTPAKLLPFWGPQRLLQHSIDPTVSIRAAIPVNLGYTLALLAVCAHTMRRRAPSPPQPGVSRAD